MSCIITVYNVFKTAMKLKLKVTVAYYEAKPNLFTHLLDSARSSLLLWIIWQDRYESNARLSDLESEHTSNYTTSSKFTTAYTYSALVL